MSKLKKIFEAIVDFDDAKRQQSGHFDFSEKDEVGAVKYLASHIKDKHIQDIIEYMSKTTGESPEVIEDHILNHPNKQYFDKAHAVAEKYMKNMHGNHIENITFDVLAELLKKNNEVQTVDSGCPKFKEKIFNKLVTYIRANNSMFMAMRDVRTGKFLPSNELMIHFVPSPALGDEYNSVTTAAAANNGHFFFNSAFMQNLINYAYLKKVKPKQRYYKSNGGDIPDEYCYIAFVIAHEFLHHCLGDFSIESSITTHPSIVHHRRQVFNKFGFKIRPGDLINYAGDLRMNHVLTRAGFEQLPLGLFSEHYNTNTKVTTVGNVVKDKQNYTYEELMIEILYELAKIQMATGKQNDPNNTDDHSKSEGGKQNQNGQNDNPSDPLNDEYNKDKKEDDKNKSDGQSSGKPEDKEGEQKDGKGKPSGKSAEEIKDEIEKAKQEAQAELDKEKAAGNIPDTPLEDPIKKAEEILKNNPKVGEEINNIDDAKKAIKEREQQINNQRTGRGESSGRDISGELTTHKGTDFTKLKPKITWQTILKKMHNVSTVPDTSYMKPKSASPRTDLDAEPLQQGNISELGKQPKILYMIDESGSMQWVRDKISAEIRNGASRTGYAKRYFVCKYSAGFSLFGVDSSIHKGARLAENNIESAKKAIRSTGSEVKFSIPLNLSDIEIFNATRGSSSTLQAEEIVLMSNAYANNFNIVIIADSDLIYGDNAQVLFKLYHNNFRDKNRFFIITDTLSTFRDVCKLLKVTGAPPNVSCINADEVV